jgi:RNA polymerase sigma-70 factor (ECF subfamily)
VHQSFDVDGLRPAAREEPHDGASLARRYSAMLRDFFRRNGTENADDLTQQTLMSFLESVGRFRGESRISTFLIGIARNKLRAHRRQTERTLRSEAVACFDIGPPSSRRSTEIREHALRRGMEQLPPDLRAVIELFYWRGIAQNDIAQRLSLPVGTVASRIRRAKEKLRAFIRSQIDPSDLTHASTRPRDDLNSRGERTSP